MHVDKTHKDIHTIVTFIYVVWSQLLNFTEPQCDTITYSDSSISVKVRNTMVYKKIL